MSLGDFLHLTSGESAARNVRETLRALGTGGRVIAFHDALQEGPLADVDAGGVRRAAWWVARGEAKAGGCVDDRARWDRIRSDPRDVVVWHGRHPSDRLFALRACWQLGAHAPRLHEVRLEEAVAMTARPSLATAWPRRRRVRNVAALARRWERIRSGAGDSLRVLRGERIVTRPTTAYDEELVGACGGAWIRSAFVVGRVLVSSGCAHSDLFLAWRIRELIARGRLDVRERKNRLGVPTEIRAVSAASGRGPS